MNIRVGKTRQQRSTEIICDEFDASVFVEEGGRESEAVEIINHSW
jgi:hypothetical protein